jgi:surface antigen
VKPVDEPPRLLDVGAHADDGLHVALGRMREKRPTGEQLAALSLSLGIAASPALTASTAKATGVKTLSAVLKWLATAVAVGGGVTAILLVHRTPASHRGAAAPISAVEERAGTKELSRDETRAHADGTSRAAEAATSGTPAVSPSGVETPPTAPDTASNGKAPATATSDVV